jgi:molecular chaperone GrpE (heat shock protein)
MCYNCGCGMPNNDMGNPKNITNKTFEEAAKAMSQSVREAKLNAYDLLRKVLAAAEESQDKNWKPAEPGNQ